MYTHLAYSTNVALPVTSYKSHDSATYYPIKLQVKYCQPVSLVILMAAVLAPSSVHSPSHLLSPHRDSFELRGSAAASPSHRNPFNAFAPHHHSSSKSRSAAASWRQSEPQAVVHQPAPARTPSPKYRRSGVSHSRTPSTSSEASSTSWRSRDRSPVTVTRADVAEEPSGEQATFL